MNATKSLHKVVVATVLASAIAACSRDGSETALGTWRAERESIGDTTIVRTISGSVWSGPAMLVEELSIGTLEGEEVLMFGQIQEIAPDEAGGVYVFDGQVPALRYYDITGRYVRTLGGNGSGPGEYRDITIGLALRRDGRLVMCDPRNARMNVYERDGKAADHWPVPSSLYTANALTLDTADHMYLKILLGRPEPNKAWRIGLLHLDDNGDVVDTIPDPKIPGEPESVGWTFGPDKVWALSPLGDMVVGVSSEYRFEVRARDGRVTRVEKVHTLVDVQPDERAEHEARNEWMRKSGQLLTGSQIPPVPAKKPFFRDLSVDNRGRIWVQLHTRAEQGEASDEDPDPDRPPALTWREPIVYDVFERNGTYLGGVSLPPRVSISVVLDDTIWGIRRGPMDEQYVVRYRLSHGPAAKKE